MINIFNFAAVPFNSPVYQRREEMMMEVAREAREVARELQDLESDLSRILSRDSPFERQNQISRFPIGAKKNVLTCLLVPGAREEEDTRGCNGVETIRSLANPPEGRIRKDSGKLLLP